MSSKARNGLANNLTGVVARLQTAEQSARNLAAVFAECLADEKTAISLVDSGDGRWNVAIHFRDRPDEAAVRALAAAAAGAAAAKAFRFERVARKDWVGESLAGLQPVQAGRFVVHGAHDRARIAPNRIGIEIEASLAFGTGHHGTTRGCLLALDRIGKALRERADPFPSPCKGKGQGGGRATRAARKSIPTRRANARRPPPSRGKKTLRVLDLGTGSGVLAIAAARALRGRARLLAGDIDADAVRVARVNARRNGVAPLIEVVRAAGVAMRGVRARAPFDLVFANILLQPLLGLAAPLRRLAAPGGRVVLSGLLTAQANAALSAYRPLALERRIDLDGWTTLVLRRLSHSPCGGGCC